MKLNESFISRQVQGDYILVSTKSTVFNGIVNANDSAGFVIECLKNDTTRDEIIKKMLEQYDVSIEIAAEDVDRVIKTLRDIGAIDE